ncbi:MAG: SagB/ThcOx family dehydrogenase [Chloroflexi bacterium]|nr:SagB/ThcOx family dehydrogenase [Chloroflexota bacterium]
MQDTEFPPVTVHSNRDVQAAWRYHQGTNHSHQSVYQNSHHMEWDNQPIPFKVYTTLRPRQLPTDFSATGMTAFEALAEPEKQGDVFPTVQDLAALLYYSAGVIRTGDLPGGGKMYFRAAACTGALYHIELYLVCGPAAGLEAGVYHYGAHDFSLRQLREGDYRQVLVEAAGGDAAVAQAPAILVLSSVFWRNSWKYQARAYRHCFWDSGTILANLLATGSARKVPQRLVSAFVDGPVNRLLGLDENTEVALQMVAVGRDSQQRLPMAPELTTLDWEVQPYSHSRVDYPAIREIHAASTLATLQDLVDIKQSPGSPPATGLGVRGPLFNLENGSEYQAADITAVRSIEETIQRRGSSRRFRRAPIGFAQLSNMLRGAVTGIPADFADGNQGPLNQLYLIVNDVDGLPSGSYVYHPDLEALEQLAEGDFRDQAGQLDLGQELAADASVNVYFLTDLAPVLDRYGNRGYRVAQMEAAIMGGRLYLGAYAQRLGATGLTFFDDDVTRFFSPHAQGKSVMFLTALGRPVRRQA